MIEKTKKQKKGLISEEDVSNLIQRYTATTILRVLQEVANYPDVKLNWNALVNNTCTGISNAEEYKMLWRHLAYGNTLIQKLDDDDDAAQSLDDDSDLEFELEPSPSVTAETSVEAAACVKVLIASGLPSDSSLTNGLMIEAPLTINIPNPQSSRVSLENSQHTCSTRGMNIIVPVSVQKQIMPSTETLEGNGLAAANLPPRRKRKPWSEAEDLELVAAVQKCGVGNWANILRGDFKGDRSASQLAQRWAIIKKRVGNINVEGNSSIPQLSEAQLATRSALSLALDMPDKNLTAACTNNHGLKIASDNAAPPTTNGEASVQTQSQLQQGPIGSAQTQNQSQQGPNTSVLAHNQPQKATLITAPSHNHPQKGPIISVSSHSQLQKGPVMSLPTKNTAHQCPVASVQIPNPSQQGFMTTKTSPRRSSCSTLKSRVTLKKPPTTYFSSTCSILDATVVAAGGRIGSPEAAASLLKAAQSKNAIHVITSGGSSVKPLIPSGPTSHLEVHSTVQFSTSHLSSVKSAAQRVEQTPSSSSPSLNVLIQQCNAVTSSPAVEGPSKEEPKEAVDIKGSTANSLPVERVRENGACVLKNEPAQGVKEQKADTLNSESKFKNLEAVVEHPNEKLVVEECQIANDSTIDCSLVKKSDSQPAAEENCRNQSMIKVMAEGSLNDRCTKDMEISSTTETTPTP